MGTPACDHWVRNLGSAMAFVEISEQELMGSEALVPDAPVARAEPSGLLTVYVSVSDFQQLPLPEIIDVEEKRVS